MTRRTTVLTAALMLLTACGAPSPEPLTQYSPPGMVNVTPSDARIHYTGRVELSAASAVFSHPGVSIKFRFKGDAIDLLLNDQGVGGKAGINYYQVILDDRPTLKLAVRPSQRVYPIGRNLAEGEHTVELIKLTESSVGPSELQGFRIRGELLEPPARMALRLEFIGDSITCGYGTEVSLMAADDPMRGFHSVNENITKAYGSLTARHLGAEAVTVCYSGRGLYRNNSGDMTGTVPQLYDRVLPDQPTSRWDFARFTPDIVVVNLGTNDFTPGMPDATRFTAAYADFVTRLRGYYPQARIICAVGPSLNDWSPPGQSQWTTIQGWVSSVVKGFNDRGDARVHYLAFTPHTEPFGEDWHPSLITHEAMAARLSEFIRTLR